MRRFAKAEVPQYVLDDYPQLRAILNLYESIRVLKEQQKELEEQIKQLEGPVREFLENRFNIMDDFYSVSVTLGNSINFLIGKIKSKSSGVINEKINYILNNVSDELRETLEQAKEEYKQLSDHVSVVIKKYEEKEGSMKFAGILDWISDAINSVIDFFRGLIDKIKDLAKQIFDVAGEIETDDYEIEDYVGVEELRYAVKKKAYTDVNIEIDINSLPEEYREMVAKSIELYAKKKEVENKIKKLKEVFDELADELFADPNIENSFEIIDKHEENVVKLAKVVIRKPRLSLKKVDYFNYLLTNINDEMKEELNKIDENAEEIEKKLYYIVGSNDEERLEEIVRLIDELKKQASIFDAFKSVGGKLFDMFKNLWNTVKTTFSNLFEKFVNKFTPMVDEFADAVDELYAEAMNDEEM